MNSISYVLGWYLVAVISFAFWCVLNGDVDSTRVELPFTPAWWRKAINGMLLLGFALWLIGRGL